MESGSGLQLIAMQFSGLVVLEVFIMVKKKKKCSLDFMEVFSGRNIMHSSGVLSKAMLFTAKDKTLFER